MDENRILREIYNEFNAYIHERFGLPIEKN